MSPLDPVRALSHVLQHHAFIGMGGNLGDVQARLIHALADIAALPGTAIEAVSPLYQTRPVDADGPDYLNAVAVVRSNLGPTELLGALLALETRHDRTRPYRHAPRTLDLDLLAYGDAQRDTPRLILPHPRLTERAFVLAPLLAVLNGWPSGQPGYGGVNDVPGVALPDAQRCQALSLAQGVVRLDAPAWEAVAQTLMDAARQIHRENDKHPKSG